MSGTILMGRVRQIIKIPRREWEKHLARVPQHSETRLGFMSEKHHLVRSVSLLLMIAMAALIALAWLAL